MRNFQDTLYACKRVPTRFKKPCSPIFLDNYTNKANKKISAHFCRHCQGDRKKNSEKGNSTLVGTLR